MSFKPIETIVGLSLTGAAMLSVIASTVVSGIRYSRLEVPHPGIHRLVEESGKSFKYIEYGNQSFGSVFYARPWVSGELSMRNPDGSGYDAFDENNNGVFGDKDSGDFFVPVHGDGTFGRSVHADTSDPRLRERIKAIAQEFSSTLEKMAQANYWR